MTIKELLIQEIQSTPDSLLEETLDFLRFLKAKETQKNSKSEVAKQKPVTSSDSIDSDKENQLTYRPASGRSILRHAGTWQGDDFEECLQSVYATRGKAKFDEENPFD